MRISIYGDSISEGIGSKRLNYANRLQEKLLEELKETVSVKNLAYTGTTIKYIREEYASHVCDDSDVVVLFYGNVDAMLRPDQTHKPNYYKRIPGRYKKNGMLNPRPYYSSNVLKKSIQKFDSWFRWNLNKWLLKKQGATTWVSVEEFDEEYRKILEMAKAEKVQVVCCSTVFVDPRYFPGTNEQYQLFNERIKANAQSFDNATYIDFFSVFQADSKWALMYEDHFHPNEKGYEVMAELIHKAIMEKVRI